MYAFNRLLLYCIMLCLLVVLLTECCSKLSVVGFESRDLRRVALS